ncbi:uncharacterized protein LOC135080203 [Ostrinia nubilalis]|uniref:uncharacterized protein LOC135080203 n=1 Tax=Ostrinia nubilalis TaxID=29057 RepID=UPI003082499D
MDTITNKMPTAQVPSHVRDSFRHLVLADNQFDRPAEIDLLLGAELFHNIYDGQRLSFGSDLPVALHSVFGWVISGKLDLSCRPPTSTTSLFASTLALDNVVKRFWEVEEPPIVKIVNPEDVKCENMLSDLVRRNSDGRYVVPIMLKDPPEELGDSHQMSMSRLHNLEKRLIRHQQLKADYVQFMQEYSDLGHMTLVDSPSGANGNIIPHHCVIRPESSSTKLRVVFDASAKTGNGKSLNDIVYTGPKLQNDVVDIITALRLDGIVFTADISKMYRNIDLRPEDRQYQHIFWRDSPEETVSEFELNTVTYGVSSSPYLAIRTLHQLAQDHGEQWPRAATALLKDTFMDDIVVTAPSVDVALEIKDELINLLDCGKFELRKWSSNSLDFLSHLPADHCQTPKAFCDKENQRTLKILGIQWDPLNDKFTYTHSEMNPACTKQIVLSSVARIYDPLGWLTPVVLLAKMFIQELWRLQLDWDEPVSTEMLQKWQDFVRELTNLSSISIPRQVVHSTTARCELVGFCDGSSKAYGCCVYLLTLDEPKTSHLLIAKSRVAPIKPVTINRLELLGAALLSRVLKNMYQLLENKINIVQVTAFTESNVVLAWLNTAPHKLKMFVAHRVVKITDDLSVDNWKHVATHDNPADLCSRGFRCSQLVSHQVWWHGPAWLVTEKSLWPVQTDISPPDIVPELKPAASHTLTASKDTNIDAIRELVKRSSSFLRSQRVLAWCLRFIGNLKKKRDDREHNTDLTTTELKNSLVVLIHNEQRRHFSKVLDSFATNSSSRCNKSLLKLSPFIDEAGLLRVGGRLRNAQLPLTAIHSFLLVICRS